MPGSTRPASIGTLFTAIAALVIISGTVSAGGLAPPTASQDSVTTTSLQPIGTIAWEIVATSSGKVLGKGDRKYTLSDVLVIADDDPAGYIEQRIPLSAGFYLKLNSGREPEPFTGFGIAAGKEDSTTFSWEWFVVDKPPIAKKLQEGGELEFTNVKTGDFYEIDQTRFLTDISLRVLDYGQGEAGDPRDPTWRVKIFKGSTIRWPTIVDGTVMFTDQVAQWRTNHPPPPTLWDSLVSVARDNVSSAPKSKN